MRIFHNKKKNQSNALAAALSSPDILVKAYQEATNAAGSAEREQQEYAKSVQYSIDQTKAKLEELANDFISSDFLKGLIDFGGKAITVIDTIIDKVGVLGISISGLSAFGFFKNLDLFIIKLVTSHTRKQRIWFCGQVCVVTF